MQLLFRFSSFIFFASISIALISLLPVSSELDFTHVPLKKHKPPPQKQSFFAKTFLSKFQSLKNFITTVPIPAQFQGPVLFKPYLNYDPHRGVNDPDQNVDAAATLFPNATPQNRSTYNKIRFWKKEKKHKIQDVKDALKNKIHADASSAAADAQTLDERREMEILRRHHMHGVVDAYRPKSTPSSWGGGGWGWNDKKVKKKKKKIDKKKKMKTKKKKKIEKKKKKESSGWGETVPVPAPEPTFGWSSASLPTLSPAKTHKKTKTKDKKTKYVTQTKSTYTTKSDNQKPNKKLSTLLPAAGSRTSSQVLTQNQTPAKTHKKTKTKDKNEKNVTQTKSTNTTKSDNQKPNHKLSTLLPAAGSRTSSQVLTQNQTPAKTHKKTKTKSKNEKKVAETKSTDTAKSDDQKPNQKLNTLFPPAGNRTSSQVLTQSQSPASSINYKPKKLKTRKNDKLMRKLVPTPFTKRTTVTDALLQPNAMKIVNRHNFQQNEKFSSGIDVDHFDEEEEEEQENISTKFNQQPFQILQFRTMPLLIYE